MHIFTFLILLYAQVAKAASSMSPAEGSLAIPTNVQLASELEAALHQNPVHDPEALSEVASFLRSVESQSTCKKIATLSLIRSCESLSNTVKGDIKAAVGSDLSLEALEKEYAIKSALCQYTDAGGGVPKTCAAFVPSAEACRRPCIGGLFTCSDKSSKVIGDRICYPSATTRQLQQCLSSLRGIDPAWMSYSNARQDAEKICNASRAAIAIDKALATYGAVTEVISNMTSVVATSYTNAVEFSKAVAHMQANLLYEVEQSTSTTRNAFSQLVFQIKSAVQSLLDDIFHGQTDAKARLNDLSKDISTNRDNVRKADLESQAYHDNELRRDKERASVQERQFEGASIKLANFQAMIDASIQQFLEQQNRTLEIMNLTSTKYSENVNKVLRWMETLDRIADIASVVRYWTGITVLVLLAGFVSKKLALAVILATVLREMLFTWNISHHLFAAIRTMTSLTSLFVPAATQTLLFFALAAPILTAACVFSYYSLKHMVRERHEEGTLLEVEVPDFQEPLPASPGFIRTFCRFIAKHC